MSLFQRVRDLLGRDRTYTADIKPLMDFASIDAAKIRADLQVDARGKERGQRNEPPSDFVGLDQVELELVSSLETLRNEAYENYSKQMSVYDGRLARVDLRTIVPDVKTMLHDAEADFGAEVRKDTNPVFAKRAELVATEAAYESFRRKNGIDWLAEPERNPVLAAGILFTIFILETVANSGFFSATHPGGLLGAIFEAAGISLINLTVGFALGIGPLRYIRLPSAFWKGSMAIVAIALIALAVTFNFFAAHYRDAFSQISPDAENFILQSSQAALQALLTRKYELLGFQSYLMVLVGLVVVTYATYKGMSWLDPFPGYGALYKRYQARLQEYISLIDALIRNLQDRKDQAILELRESITDIRRRDEEYGTIVSERARLTHRYNGYLEALQRAAEGLLSIYREANRAARTDPPPKAFASVWESGWAKEIVPGDDGKDERRRASDELLAAIAQSQEKLLGAFNEALGEYDKLRDFSTAEGSRGAATAA
jgi:hypothetical protein